MDTSKKENSAKFATAKKKQVLVDKFWKFVESQCAPQQKTVSCSLERAVFLKNKVALMRTEDVSFTSNAPVFARAICGMPLRTKRRKENILAVQHKMLDQRYISCPVMLVVEDISQPPFSSPTLLVVKEYR